MKQLLGVNNIAVDKQESELFIEAADGSGIVVSLNAHELMHLLDKFTDEEYGPDKIYGIDRIDGLDEDW